MASDSAEHEADLERQRAGIEAIFRNGWTATNTGPRVLTAVAYAQARKVIDRGAPPSLDQATISAVRDGAQPGDLLPPPERRPFISRVGDDVDVIITGSGAQRRAAVLFTHQDFPGAHFGHRFPEPWTGAAQHASIWLMEEIETKALHRMMRNQPSTDDAGIIWTTWGSG
jgi:hypothetical protein